IDHAVVAGTYYYLARKKTRSSGESYTVRAGDDLWRVSQQTGVQLKRLKRYNKQLTGSLKSGDVVWLDNTKPAGTNTLPVLEPVTEETTVIAEVDANSFFNWAIRPKETSVVSVVEQPPLVQPEPDTKTIIKTDTSGLAPQQDTSVEQPASHMVKQGETLYAIARQYNVAVTDLVEWNSLDLTSGIKPNQVLTLKPVSKEEIQPQSSQPQFIVHEVRESDTLYSVARQYNVTIKDIMAWNKKEDFKIARGEKLKILTQ
ncbi:MAG TPA: LysM peptidoglycan-binding domain-containing protein, partial [Cyclobacteriaceae bacterium]|nr:LysM peptidoglycan-binding domain-containing protein [Cyclobacteriaceae bacterium]